MTSKARQLIEIYKAMPEKELDEEIDALFEIIFAMLEAKECDSMETYPNPSVKLRFSCEVIKEESQYIN